MSDQVGVLPLTAEETIQLRWAINEWMVRAPYYRIYRHYFEGHHRLLSVNSKWQAWFANMLEQTKLNLCESVIDAVIDRLSIASWLVTGENEGQEKAMLAAWEYSQGPAVMNEVHEGACIEGDSAILVWPDANNKLRMWPHRGDEMILYYPPELPDIPVLGLKIWRDTPDRWRLNAYWPDRVDRFITRNGASFGMTGIETWTNGQMKLETILQMVEDETGTSVPNPVGNEVPIAHFTPGRLGNAIGDSDLRNAISVQDALNKSLIDLIVSGEGAALPLRVLTGVQSMKDPDTGSDTGPKYDPRKDSWMNIANEQAKLWTAAGVDPIALISVVEHHITNMARVTHTPPDRLLAKAGGDPSGSARKMGEAPLTSKSLTRKQQFDPSWRRTMKLLGFSGFPKWGPTEYTTDNDSWDLAMKKVQAGVPLPHVLLEMGYTKDQVEDMNKLAKKYPMLTPAQSAAEMTGALGRAQPSNVPKTQEKAEKSRSNTGTA